MLGILQVTFLLMPVVSFILIQSKKNKWGFFNVVHNNYYNHQMVAILSLPKVVPTKNFGHN